MIYDCIIVGGGIAGLQAAIQLGRYNHKVLVVDSNYGRSTICKSYHNILGYPDGVSGEELRSLGKRHAKALGVHFELDTIITADIESEAIKLSSINGKYYHAKRLLLATGVMDRIPIYDLLAPYLGLSVYVCPDCDGYEIKDKRTIVMGSGDVGANMCLTLTYWTDNIVYINHENQSVSEELQNELNHNHIKTVNEPIVGIKNDGDLFTGVLLKSGEKINGERGFVAFGGNSVNSDLAKQLGVERLENKHIVVDPRTKMTKVTNVWAAGDVVAHSEQVTIAMGEGSQAAIWIHKSLI